MGHVWSEQENEADLVRGPRPTVSEPKADLKGPILAPREPALAPAGIPISGEPDLDVRAFRPVDRWVVNDRITTPVPGWPAARCHSPDLMIASAGASTTPNQCGVQVENSTASPGLMAKSRSPRTSRNRPDST